MSILALVQAMAVTLPGTALPTGSCLAVICVSTFVNVQPGVAAYECPWL